MRKNELRVDQIYRLTKGLDGLKVCVLKSNRNNVVKNKKMMEGCKEVGMQSPGIFAEASLAMEAGYVLLDVVDGHVITEEEVGDYLVIADGNTRFHAMQLALKDGQPFEYIFQYKQYANAAAFRAAYLKMNVCNTPTTTADFARDLAAVSNNPVVEAYRSKTNDGLTPKAAGFATIGREIMKKDMVELQKGNVPSLFNNDENYRLFETIYASTAALRAVCISMFKGSEIWSWIAAKINGADDKQAMADRLARMFNNFPGAETIAIQKAKKDGNRSKEAVVKDLLDKVFSKFD